MKRKPASILPTPREFPVMARRVNDPVEVVGIIKSLLHQLIREEHTNIGHPVLLDTEATAAMLGISPYTLADWRWKRLGPPWIRMSRSCVRYDLAQLKAWLTENTIERIP